MKTDISIPHVTLKTVPSTADIEARKPRLREKEREELIRQIRQLLREQDAVLVAHYYTDEDLQRVAEESGGYVSDSLDMARFGHEHPASTLVVAGVRFMGETAKILNPEKRVLMPTLEATCSLDQSCPAAEFNGFCDAHPDRTVVVYANTSAGVKARADWVVTSGIALEVIRHLKDRGEKILWAPDRYLGSYVERTTGADMVLWRGSCVVHEEFKGQQLKSLMQQHREAAVLVHPESPESVIELADVVGSTTRLIQAARELPNPEFIVATDRGIFYKMKQAAPGRKLIEAPTAGDGATCTSCAHCPWMAMNSLQDLLRVLGTGENEICVEEEVRARALRSIQRMLEFAGRRRVEVLGQSSA